MGARVVFWLFHFEVFTLIARVENSKERELTLSPSITTPLCFSSVFSLSLSVGFPIRNSSPQPSTKPSGIDIYHETPLMGFVFDSSYID